jgi:hypothetical protein
LDKLRCHKLGKVFYAQEDASVLDNFKAVFGATFTHNSKGFYSKKIQIITAPLSEAINKAWDKIHNVDFIKEVLDGCYGGTLIKGNQSICYFIEPTTNGDYAFTIFTFDLTDTHELFFSGFCSYVARSDANPLMYGTSLHTYPKGLSNHFMSILFTVIATINFLKYADVEVKHLMPKEKAKEVRCKYINETSLPLEIIDSRWFTTLVKSDAFKVRGHFRLQPCGEGLKDRKLIWINDFEKSGYTAPARKLSLEDATS